jgi:predicted peptidase
MKPQHAFPFAFALLLITTLCATAADAPAGKSGEQTHQMYKVDGQDKLGYLLFLPADYGKDAAKKWPVIVFLHGSGEAGDGTTQLDKVKIHGPPKIVERKKDFGFIVISPQNPIPDRNNSNSRRGWDPKAVKGVLDEVLANHKQADADRVYLTGLSLGGFGSWATAAAYPDTFAAIAPICGGGDPGSADKVKHLPIWVFHGEKDTAVKIEQSEAMVNALKAAGAKEVEFTRYPDKPHDCWTVTYDNPKLYEWFLKHTRKQEKAGK